MNKIILCVHNLSILCLRDRAKFCTCDLLFQPKDSPLMLGRWIRSEILQVDFVFEFCGLIQSLDFADKFCLRISQALSVFEFC